MEATNELRKLLLDQSNLKSELFDSKLKLAKKLMNSENLTAEEIPMEWEKIERAAAVWINNLEERNK